MNERAQRRLLASGLLSTYVAATRRHHTKQERGHAFVAAGLQLAHGQAYDDLHRAALAYGRHCRATGEKPVDGLTFFSTTWWTFAQEPACVAAQATPATRHDH